MKNQTDQVNIRNIMVNNDADCDLSIYDTDRKMTTSRSSVPRKLYSSLFSILLSMQVLDSLDLFFTQRRRLRRRRLGLHKAHHKDQAKRKNKDRPEP